MKIVVKSSLNCTKCEILACTGLLAAVGSMASDASGPIMHLRDINTYVSAAINDWRKNSDLRARMPRQPSSGLLSSSGSAGSLSAIMGTSSFGMSGVNAHALLSHPGSGHIHHKPANVQQLQGSRYWSFPDLNPFVHMIIPTAGELLIQSNLATANLAYLYDHQVSTAKALLECIDSIANGNLLRILKNFYQHYLLDTLGM